jgi:hypothetical protein
MSLGLHPSCKKRLREIIAEGLEGVKINNGNSIDVDSCQRFFELDRVLPESGPIRDQLYEYIGDFPTFRFIMAALGNEISAKLKYQTDAESIDLQSVDGYGNLEAVAHRLVENFESLPHEYSLGISFVNDFGKLFSKRIQKCQISDSVKLFRHDEFEKEIPFQSDAELGPLAKLIHKHYKFYEDSMYFQVKVHGLITRWGTTTPIDQAMAVFKAFVGLGIVLRLFKIDSTREWYPKELDPIFAIHRRIGNVWEFERDYRVDSSLDETYRHLVLDDLNGKLDRDDEKAKWIEGRLKLIQSAFSSKKDANKILLASEWFLDSCGKTHGLLFPFVQTAIVLEILLGEKARSDLLSLGELLGNRCAYLIAKSHEEREHILESFRKFYTVRSKIVHEGKTRLIGAEKELFYELQDVCAKVIRKELELLNS